MDSARRDGVTLPGADYLINQLISSGKRVLVQRKLLSSPCPGNMVRGQTARERTVGHQENLPSGGPGKGGASGHLLGKRRPPEVDPGPFSQKMRNAETDTKMRELHDPPSICTHVYPRFCICSLGSAEAWFAMPALWTTRRESATAHPAPRGEMPRFSDRDPSRTGCSIPPDPSPWPLPAL